MSVIGLRSFSWSHQNQNHVRDKEDISTSGATVAGDVAVAVLKQLE